MFDTMVYTKALGALCGALLIFLLGKWVADEMFKPLGRGTEQAYLIDTGVDDAPAEAVAELTFEAAFLLADADAGARQWSQCRACHALEDGRNGVGPHLYNIVGREAHAVEGFNYSGALPDVIWSPQEISAFIANPREYAPGTSMSYAGLRGLQDRANLVAYLIDFSPDYVPVESAAPVEVAPVEDIVVEEAPVEVAPVEEAPAEEAPAEEAVTDEAPVDEAPVEEAPAVAEAQIEEAPAEETATEEAAAADAVTEEAVTEEAAIEEAPADEAVAEQNVTEEAPAAEMSEFAMAVASADPAAGQRVFRQCQACHVANAETNRVGPHLKDLVGREKNAVPGFRYSGNLPDGVWTLDALDAFLTNPREYAPGTSMVFQGLRSVEDRAAVIAFIESQ